MALASWAAGFVGIPWRPFGRSREGCDCYGLARLVQGEVFSRELPSFEGSYQDPELVKDVAALVELERPLIGAREVEAPEPGDLVLMSFFGSPCHIGVFAGDGFVLHVERNVGASCLERLDSSRLRSRVRGFYRVA